MPTRMCSASRSRLAPGRHFQPRNEGFQALAAPFPADPNSRAARVLRAARSAASRRACPDLPRNAPTARTTPPLPQVRAVGCGGRPDGWRHARPHPVGFEFAAPTALPFPKAFQTLQPRFHWVQCAFHLLATTSISFLESGFVNGLRLKGTKKLRDAQRFVGERTPQWPAEAMRFFLAHRLNFIVCCLRSFSSSTDHRRDH